VRLVPGEIYVYFCFWIIPPHKKIALYICEENDFVFWFNSEPRFHKIGQLVVADGAHTAINKDCYLDLSGVKKMDPNEIPKAKSRGPVKGKLRKDILGMLENEIITLPDIHKKMAIAALKHS